MNVVIETGGKQYKVSEGSIIKVEKLKANIGDKVVLDKIKAIVNNDTITIGKPNIDKAKVIAKVLSQEKAKKVIVFKYKAKTGYRRKNGHRQNYTILKIEKIEV